MEGIIEKLCLRKEKDLQNRRFSFYEKNKIAINELFDIVELFDLQVDYSDFIIFCYNNSIHE